MADSDGAVADNPASVLVKVVEGVGTITLNRPKAINALDHEMALAMEQALLGWAVDSEITGAVVRGAGERGLCAGGDIVAIHRDAAMLSTGDKTDADAAASPSAAFWRDEYRLNTLISRYPKPYVAIMDGIVMGGGVGISAHGNTRVVTDRTKLGMPEVGIGFIPDVGGTHLLSKVPDELGTYVALTAGTIRAADAIAIGLADHYIPADGLAAALERWKPGQAFPGADPGESALTDQRGWISEAFAGDSVADIIARCRELGTPEATKAADIIEAKSPLAAAVTLRALREAASRDDLAESLRVEYRLALRSLRNPDMAEGIRAQVIDKDRNPTWRHADHSSVTAAEVDVFFEPLPVELELPIEAWGVPGE